MLCVSEFFYFLFPLVGVPSRVSRLPNPSPLDLSIPRRTCRVNILLLPRLVVEYSPFSWFVCPLVPNLIRVFHAFEQQIGTKMPFSK